jgi:hypothetical protein
MNRAPNEVIKHAFAYKANTIKVTIYAFACFLSKDERDQSFKKMKQSLKKTAITIGSLPT